MNDFLDLGLIKMKRDEFSDLSFDKAQTIHTPRLPICTFRLISVSTVIRIRLLCRVIWFINRLISISIVSIWITLLHVRGFTPVSVIGICLMRWVLWFINRWSRSHVQVWQLSLVQVWQLSLVQGCHVPAHYIRCV
ncbi:hypothetical protein Hanom_Chr00s000004g01607791 [Helianthus anomalus]